MVTSTAASNNACPPVSVSVALACPDFRTAQPVKLSFSRFAQQRAHDENSPIRRRSSGRPGRRPCPAFRALSRRQTDRHASWCDRRETRYPPPMSRSESVLVETNTLRIMAAYDLSRNEIRNR